MAPAEAIRILIVDDHPLLRDGLSALVSSQADMVVAGEAGTIEEALAAVVLCRPTVVLLDLRFPDGAGLDVLHHLRSTCPSARTLVISNCQGEADIARAMDAGAAGYLFKTSARKDVLAAIRAVAAGKIFLSREVAESYVQKFSHAPLTAREQQVLECIAQGLRNKVIAFELNISEHTVKEHIGKIFGKLGVGDRTSLLKVAEQKGLIHLSEP